MQRNTLPDVLGHFGNYLRLPAGNADLHPRPPRARLDSDRSHREQPAHRRDRASRAVLGPRQGGRLFPCLFRLADLRRVPDLAVPVASRPAAALGERRLASMKTQARFVIALLLLLGTALFL